MISCTPITFLRTNRCVALFSFYLRPDKFDVLRHEGNELNFRFPRVPASLYFLHNVVPPVIRSHFAMR